MSDKAHATLSSRERIVSLAAIALLFLIFFGAALRAQFYVIEDHLLLMGLDWGPADWLERIRADMEAFQRVRPAYWVYIALGDRAFGANPHLWHLAAIAWGVLSSYLFYLVLRRLGADRVSGTVFVLLYVLGADHNWVWMNLIPQETTGMVPGAIAVWAIVKAADRPRPTPWDALAVLASALAGLIKESFIVLIPALVVLRLACSVNRSGGTWREALREARIFVFGGLVVFVAELGFVAILVLTKPAGYSATASGMSLSSLSPIRLIGVLATPAAAGALVLLVASWGAMWFDRNIRRDLLVAAAIILGLWLAPQVVLYSNGLQGRYLLPSIAGAAGAVALAIAYLLRQRRLRLFGWLSVFAVLPVVAHGASVTATTLGGFTAETVSVHQAVEFLAQNVPPGKPILIVTDSGTAYGFEATYSVPMFLRRAGLQSPVYLWPIVSRGERSPMHIAASQNNTAFKYPDTLTPRQVGGIIILDKWIPSFDPEPFSDWLGTTGWREIVFREPYYGLSIRSRGYRQIGEVSHRLLLPAESSSAPTARPLVSVDETLAGVVRVSPFFDPPPWGLENDYAGPGSIVWLGQGDAEALGGELSSTIEQRVELVFEVIPGPSAPGTQRNVELETKSHGTAHIQRTTVDGGQWHLQMTLEPGANHFRVRVLDPATVSVQPNGDTRRLMALIRGISVRAASAQ